MRYLVAEPRARTMPFIVLLCLSFPFKGGVFGIDAISEKPTKKTHRASTACIGLLQHIYLLAGDVEIFVGYLTGGV